MKISAVTVLVKKEHIEDFIAASLIHQANTIKEKGNLRFDFLQCKDEPSRFMFYEAYESQEDIELHRSAPSYQTWRKTVEDWMAVPRQGTAFKALAPTEGRMFRYP
jgi:(4S)-4-hydroxy-5-phosphonooxypentane-2,3-dione isomerase